MLLQELEPTKERILEYARGLVERYPTYVESRLHDGEIVPTNTVNTVVHELRNLLGRWYAARLSWMSQSDLREQLHDLWLNGTDSTPVYEMEQDELVEEIWDGIVVLAIENDPDATWDDVLAEHPTIWLEELDEFEAYQT